jgi:hypothetical protein
MFNKILSLVLIAALMDVAGITLAYAAKEDKEASFTEKVKDSISRLGTGKATQVEVKLRDDTKLKGYIKQASESSFLLVDRNTDKETIVHYAQVQQVKGNNFSKGEKIALGVGITAGVLFLIWLILASRD